MSVILKQFDGGAIAPRDDAILYNSIITRNGILDGCTITHLGANQIKITAGRGIIKGRMFEVEEMTVNCQLASAGTQKGRMYLRMELSNMENPAQIKTVAADTLPELVQEEDCNYTNGIYELELCTYDVTDTLLSNLKTTYEVIDTVFPVAKTLDDVNGVTDEDVLAGALAVKELNSELQAWFGVTEDGQRGWKEQGADTVIPFSRATKVLAMFHASTSGITRYTAEKKIFGLTMVTEDARESYTVLKVNGEDQPVKDIAQISSTYVSGYQTYDITLNPGDEVAVTNRGGGGSDIVLLSGIVQSANQ